MLRAGAGFHDVTKSGVTSRSARGAHVGWSGRSEFILKVTGRRTISEVPSESQWLARPGFTLTRDRYELPADTGRGYWELIRLAPDLMVVQTSTTYARRINMIAPGEGYIEFHFRLSGRLCLNEGSTDETDLRKPCLLIQRQAPGCEVAEFIEGGVHDSSVTIYCRPEALQRTFGPYREGLPAQLAEAFGDPFGGIFRLRLALYPRLARPVRDLAKLTGNDSTRLAYTEALVEQALCEILALLPGRSHGTGGFYRLHNRDVSRLQKARDQILSQHTPAARLEDIARQVGLSSTKLKKGFKALFGQTPHEFATELRMSAAADLLREGDLSIGAVSQALGFKYQNSFTLAFVRRFGVLPKDYRVNPLQFPAQGSRIQHD